MDYITSSIQENAGHDIPRIPMRNKIHCQTRLPLWGRLPKVVKDYHAKYDQISGILDDNPGIFDAVHADLSRPCSPSGQQSPYSSEQFLRMFVVKVIEGVSLREVFVQVSDSVFFAAFYQNI